MTTRAQINRPITSEELAVIYAALERASLVQEQPPSKFKVEDLQVVGRCACGCDSVDFSSVDAKHPSKPIADGLGETPAGGTVGVMVWANDEAITALEVYDMGAGDNDIKLPVPASIRKLSQGGA